MADAQGDTLVDDEDIHDADDEGHNNAVERSTTSSELRSRKRSDVWPFIKELGNGRYSCKCCEREGKTQVWNSTAHTTMRNHLKQYHGDEYGGGTDASTSRQTDLFYHGFERMVKQRLGSDFSKADADQALVDWVVSNAQPFLAVEQPKFIAFCATLQPSYKVPCRQTVRSHAIQRWKVEKNLARKIILRCLILEDVGASCTSITTDLWTSPAKKGREQQHAHGRDGVHRPTGAQVERQAAGLLLLQHGRRGRQHAPDQVQIEEPAGAQHLGDLPPEEVEPQHVGAQVAQRHLAEHGCEQRVVRRWAVDVVKCVSMSFICARRSVDDCALIQPTVTKTLAEMRPKTTWSPESELPELLELWRTWFVLCCGLKRVRRGGARSQLRCSEAARRRAQGQGRTQHQSKLKFRGSTLDPVLDVLIERS